MMNTMVVVIMYGSNIVDDYNDYDGCIIVFCFIRLYLAQSVDPHLCSLLFFISHFCFSSLTSVLSFV